jgi:hypothetical protein
MVLDSRSRVDSTEVLNNNGHSTKASSNDSGETADPSNSSVSIPLSPVVQKKSIGKW